MSEYSTAFLSLARFASAFVSTEKQEARMFERGIRDEVRRRVDVLQLLTFSTMLDIALIAERGIQQQPNSQNNKRSGGNQFQGQGNKRQNSGSSSARSNSGGRIRPKCNICTKFHWGECYVAKMTSSSRTSGSGQGSTRGGQKNARSNIAAVQSFDCGEFGHRARDCPRRRQQLVGSAPTPPLPRRDQCEDRSFQLRPGDIVPVETVVSSTIAICTHSITILIDTGSTQSFILHHFAMLLDVPFEELRYIYLLQCH